MPLGLFRQRNLATANVMGVLWAASMFAAFFLSALYLQLVLGYTPLQVGLAFLLGNLLMAVFSVSLSAKLVMRFGIKRPLGTGLALAGLGLLLLARAPIDGNYIVDVLPSMLLIGLGAGIAFNPMLLAAMSDVRPEQAGLASGMVNTSFMLGGALGLAVLASVGMALGILCGFATHVRVRLDGVALARVGWVAGALLVAGIAARMVFAFAVAHGAEPAVRSFSVGHQIGAAAWPVALVSMALCEVTARLVTVQLRGRTLSIVCMR